MNESTGAQARVLQWLAGLQAGSEGVATLEQFRSFVAGHPDCCERTLLVGHCTGSAWLVSPDGRRALLMHHRKLDRWLQLGGHADGEGDLAAVALREAEEESGLSGLSIEGGVFDLDRHLIPARGDEPAHWHYDMRFVVRASREDFMANEESHALAWRDIAEIAGDPSMDESLRRMALKWLR